MKQPSSDYTPAEVLADHEERAAIMEHDGGLQRADADRLAWEAMRKRHGIGRVAAARKLVQS